MERTETRMRRLVWGVAILIAIFLGALIPFLAQASTFKWSKLGGAPLIPGGIRNQDEFSKKLDDPVIRANFLDGFRKAYPDYNTNELFKAFELAVESSTLSENSYRPGTILPDGMIYKPKSGVHYESRPVEWLGSETLHSLEIPFFYEEKEFRVSVIKECGNSVPWKPRELKPPKAEMPPAQPGPPSAPPKEVGKEKEVVKEIHHYHYEQPSGRPSGWEITERIIGAVVGVAMAWGPPPVVVAEHPHYKIQKRVVVQRHYHYPRYCPSSGGPGRH